MYLLFVLLVVMFLAILFETLWRVVEANKFLENSTPIAEMTKK